ncbi:MAG: Gfo/Idh/MocA family oxidoreductase [Acidobacteriota bacterium]
MLFNPVKVGVVGVGALGEHHARIYAGLEETELVALVDIQAERAHTLASRYGSAAYTDYEQIFDLVEAVSLAVPTNEHARIGRHFLERGIHVLVEKPIAHDLEGADELIAAQQAGGVLHVGHSERFNPAFQAVRPHVKTPQFFEAHRLGIFVPRSLDVDVVLDLMIHDLDLILLMVKSRICEVRAVGIPVLTPRIDIANARIEFEDGCVANLTASRVSREKIRKLRFFQPHDYLSIDFHQQEVEMFSLAEDGHERRIMQRELEIRHDEPLRQEILSFIGAIRGQDIGQDLPAGCSGDEGKRALELALRILGEMSR